MRLLLLKERLLFDGFALFCREASKFHNKISQYHIRYHIKFNHYHNSVNSRRFTAENAQASRFTTSHGADLERFRNLLLHNNSVNQLARAQSPTLSPRVSQTEIYVPNMRDWAIAKKCKSNSTKCVTQSLAELCANRSISSMSIKVIKILKFLNVLNVQSTLNFFPLLQFDESFYQPARPPVFSVGTLMRQH